jgi:hypothetical protein
MIHNINDGIVKICQKLRQYPFLKDSDIDDELGKEGIKYLIIWTGRQNDLQQSIAGFTEPQKKTVIDAVKTIKPFWFHIISIDTHKIIWASNEKDVEK